MIRLSDIEPAPLALSAARTLYAQCAAKLAALGPPRALSPGDPTVLTRSPVYLRTRALAAYAVGSGRLPARRDASAEVAWLTDVLGLGSLPAEPRNALEAALLGALARQQYERQKPLTAAQLGLLAGYDRDSILAIAAQIPGAHRTSENRHRPWRFRVTKALTAWLERRERSVA